MKALKYIASYMVYAVAAAILLGVSIAVAIYFLVTDTSFQDAAVLSAASMAMLGYLTGIGLRSILLRKKN